MPNKLRIVMAQLNALVGDLNGNAKKVIQAATKARDDLNADIIIFPELFLTGYPPEDLLYRPAFLRDCDKTLKKIVLDIKGIYCLLGHPNQTNQNLFNAASLFYNGEILGTYNKQCLPNFDVFDEHRYFTAGTQSLVLNIHNIPVGILICEDLWHKQPIQDVVSQGAKLILAPNASPFSLEKADTRKNILLQHVKKHHLPIIYTNLLGGQDGLVFDGGSLAMNASGNIAVQAPFFEESLTPVDFFLEGKKTSLKKQVVPPALSLEEKAYHALVLGLRDYVKKNGFSGVLLGLSGGIDSALTLTIAVDALGPENVEAVLMPSRYTTDLSNNLALEQAKNMKVNYHIIPIEPPFKGFLETLSDTFQDTEVDITEQNLQARCRGTILMALSNKFGKMVITTGNRSELATGYSTLYGDMAGSFCALIDVPKMLVYKLANYRNTLSSVIPQAVIDRDPSAELAHDQKDEDSLPSYEILDKILELYINQEMSCDDIIAQGFSRTDVEHTIKLVKRNEYKRRQAPPGVRLQRRAFGRDRRYPMTQAYEDYPGSSSSV